LKVCKITNDSPSRPKDMRVESAFGSKKPCHTGPVAKSPIASADVSGTTCRSRWFLFLCAHPALDPTIRTPLMLQCVPGLDAALQTALHLTDDPARRDHLTDRMA